MYHILIIEDEVELLKPITHLLEAKGFRVSSCARSETAVEAVKRTKPDLILLDLIPPYLSGFEICKQIRLLSDIPIIIISGKSTPEDLQTLFLLGIDDFVQKPFNIKEVILRVRSVLKRCVVN
jgi:DNA-binding response OmpR family regulator